MVAMVVFSEDAARLGAFYAAVLDTAVERHPDGTVRVAFDDGGVLVHEIPEAFRDPSDHASAANPRSDVAIKPVLSVLDLERALVSVLTTGGALTDRRFHDGEVDCADVVDCDGNVVHLRCVAP